MQFEDILYEKKEGIARITINRPKVLNSFRSKTLDELAAAFEDANADKTIGVVVLTGAGDRAFCAGGDISEMGELNSAAGRNFLGKCLKVSTAIRNCSKPVIAMVRGYCLGGGHELHLMCDITLAAESAQFGQTGPMVGSVPIWGGTQMLPRIVGMARAGELLMTGDFIGAQEAHRIGLYNRVVPDGEALAAATELARKLSRGPSFALEITKDALNREAAMDLPSALEAEAQIQAALMLHPDFRESYEAFVAKREPRFL